MVVTVTMTYDVGFWSEAKRIEGLVDDGPRLWSDLVKVDKRVFSQYVLAISGSGDR
jgi:hypothetical protein